MAKNGEKKEFCPVCGKVEISRVRPPLDAGILDAGGWHVRCPFCKRLIRIPLDETKPIEAAAVHGDSALELDTIIFNSEIKLLEAMASGKKEER